MSDGDTILICVRVADMVTPVAGAWKAECEICAEPIWVSPSAPSAARRQCALCVKDTIDPGAKFAAPAPEQWEELRKHFEKYGH